MPLPVKLIRLARRIGLSMGTAMNVPAKILLGLFGLLAFGASLAQDIRDDEADVLLTIEREWEASRKNDHDKVADMLTADFMAWEKDSPAPRTRQSTTRWNRISDEMGRVLRYELYPLSITVHGDVAVAHYLYSVAFRPKDAKVEMSSGRYTDVLVRVEDGWQFLAWHGGDD